MDRVKKYTNLFIEILQKYPLTSIYNLDIPIGVFDSDYLPENEVESFKAGDYFIILHSPEDYSYKHKLRQLVTEMIPIISQIKLPDIHERKDILEVLKELEHVVEDNSLHFVYSYYCPLDDKVCKTIIGEEDECRLSVVSEECKQMYDSREFVTNEECCFYIDEIIKMIELTRSRMVVKSSMK